MPSSLCIVSIDSLLGAHLTSLLLNSNPDSFLSSFPSDLRLWSKDNKSSLPYSIVSSSLLSSSGVTLFHGESSLEDAVKDVEMVINCVETVDWSIIPDVDKLNKWNDDFPQLLSSLLPPSTSLLHVSSSLVQTSTLWPNIACQERSSSKYENEWPFPEYCKSRVEGERKVLIREGKTMIVRTVPLYGEGDTSSIATDAIKMATVLNGLIPVVGDRGGCMQIAYAGNVAVGVLRTMRKMEEEELGEETGRQFSRVIHIGDSTPRKDVYSIVHPLISDGKRRLTSYSIPFFLLYIPILLLSLLIHSIPSFITIPSSIRQLPSPSFLYFFFRHWTFFNGLKNELLLNHSDHFSQDEILSRCGPFYRRLLSEEIPSWSWKNH